MADPIDFDVLWHKHPFNNAQQAPCRFTETNGAQLKGLPAFSNQCAIRMGVALRNAGVSQAQLGGVRTCWYHGSDRLHVLNAQELANAISRGGIPGVGSVEKLVATDAINFYPKVFGRRGIIFFKDYWARSVKDGSGNWIKEPSATGDHIDVWNGYRTTAAWLMEWFSWLGYYSNYRESREIWFWEIK